MKNITVVCTALKLDVSTCTFSSETQHLAENTNKILSKVLIDILSMDHYYILKRTQDWLDFQCYKAYNFMENIWKYFRVAACEMIKMKIFNVWWLMQIFMILM